METRTKLITIILISIVSLFWGTFSLANNELTISGRIEGTGTFFEIKDSEYLNIRIESTEEIKVVLESIPRMVSMDIGSSTGSAISTLLTISGLEPNKTYHKYQDSYKNEVVFISDENGNFSWTQDLIQPHHIWFQEIKGTIFLPEDCSKYGTWDDATKTCTLTQDIAQSIEIALIETQTDNITLDCNGHQISGSGASAGIFLTGFWKREAGGLKNVTVKNCIVSNFSCGIYMDFTVQSNLENNIIQNNYVGIQFQNSPNNLVVGNTIEKNQRGIYISYSGNNTFNSNKIQLNKDAIILANYSGNNILRNNTLLGNQYSIYLCFDGCYPPVDIHQDIDTSNTINGKPIYYLVDQTDKEISGEAGFVALIDSSNIMVKNLTLSNNFWGILLFSTNNSKIENVQASQNYYGIYLFQSSNNILLNNQLLNNEIPAWLTESNGNIFRGNTIKSNNYFLRISSSPNNIFYHNNFVNNYFKPQVWVTGANNIFDNGYPSGGNYWSDYTGIDADGDGIGDTSYTFTGGQDNYPFMKENGWITNQPPTISNINQYKSDGETLISEGAITTEDIVVLKATLNDPDNDQVKLQIELKEYGQEFNGQDLLESDFVNSGSEIVVSRESLVAGSYHWRVRAADDKDNSSEWQEFGEAGNVDFIVKTLQQAAADLAKELVNSAYLYGGKGWDFNLSEFVAPSTVKTGYNFWNQSLETPSVDFGSGVDCSGLIMWAYDRSFNPKKSRFKNFVKAEGANEQYRYNTTSTTEAELKPGDVMFFDFYPTNAPNGSIDHVAMYVGESGGYDVVNAASPRDGIVARSKDRLKQLPRFVAFKQVVSAIKLPVLVTASSPVDLIVSDPDGFTITPTTTVPSDVEFLREIPDVLYYSEMERGTDGNPIDQVYSYTLKTGDYTIKVLSTPGASPTSTYTLNFYTANQSTTLAQDVPISQIPSQGYGVTTSESGTISPFTPVAIDIKPGSYPNSINLKSNGVTPVAIFGSATFDINEIRIDTIKFAEVAIKLKNNGQLMASYEDLNGDGIIDLIIHFVTKELNLTSSDTKANLEGRLISGEIIKGSDSVRIVP